MADPTRDVAASGASGDPVPGDHDGRFGKYFDDEISVSGVLWTTVWLAVFCVLGMGITWLMRGYYADRAEASGGRSLPVAAAHEAELPPEPRLQGIPGSRPRPEAQLEQMRHEDNKHLHGYGWVDEGAGIVHVPIDKAMDLLLEQLAEAAAVEPSTEGESREGGE